MALEGTGDQGITAETKQPQELPWRKHVETKIAEKTSDNPVRRAELSTRAHILRPIVVNPDAYTQEQKKEIRAYARAAGQRERERLEQAKEAGLFTQLNGLAQEVAVDMYGQTPYGTEDTRKFYELASAFRSAWNWSQLPELDNRFQELQDTVVSRELDYTDEEIADHAVDVHFSTIDYVSSSVSDYITEHYKELSDEQKDAIGRAPWDFEKWAREQLGEKEPGIEAAITMKDMGHISALGDEKPKAIGKLLEKLGVKPAEVTLEAFLRAHADKAEELPRWRVATTGEKRLEFPTTINDVSMYVNVNGDTMDMTGFGVKLYRNALKDLLVSEKRQGVSPHRTYNYNSLADEQESDFSKDKAEMAIQENIGNVVDTILFDIAQKTPESQRNDVLPSLAHAATILRKYGAEKSSGIRKEMDRIRYERDMEGKETQDDIVLFDEADEVYFHPGHRPLGLVQRLDSVGLLSGHEDMIMEILARIDAIPQGTSADSLKNSDAFQKTQREGTIYQLETALPGVRVNVGTGQDNTMGLVLVLDRNARRSLVMGKASETSATEDYVKGYEAAQKAEARQIDLAARRVKLQEDLAFFEKELSGKPATLIESRWLGLRKKEVPNPEHAGTTYVLQGIREQLQQLDTEEDQAA